METETLSLSTTTTPPPPEDLQPAAKKPKMSSTTTTSDDEDTLTTTTTTTTDGAATPKPRRYKRRKVAIFFAYCGVGYQGMQKNPGAKTIEGDLEEALYHAGAVPDEDRGQPKRFDWARSARTDKGVSAVGQVVSGRFFVDPPGFVERLNSFLSPQIRIFGYKRATPSFNAKKFCDRRRYVYLLPVFALDPCCHRDRESVLASLGSGDELVKCFECSERGRKVVGLMGNKRDLVNKVESDVGMVDSEVFVQSGISSNSESALVITEDKEKCDVSMGNGNDGVVEILKNDVGVANSEVLVESGISSNNEPALISHEDKDVSNVSLGNDDNGVDEHLINDVGVVNSEVLVESGVTSNNEATCLTTEEKEKEQCNASLGNHNGVGEPNDVNSGSVNGKGEKRSEFKYGDEEKARFNRILKNYEGTHNFHNFTTRTKAEDPSAKRYIVSFEANTTLTLEGIEFVKCEVVGQSFMLHQIRKMIGMAVAVMRNFAPESIFDTAFQSDVRINVPTAPEVGLYLDECFFTSYNNKWKNTHEELSMKAYSEEAEEFKLKHIYSHIAKTEHKEGSVALWLHSLNYRNYPDLHPADSGSDATTECKSTGVETPVEGDTMAMST